jgi:hypothetical protein
MKKIFCYLLLSLMASFVCSCSKQVTRTSIGRDPFSFVSGDKISIVSYNINDEKGTITFKDVRTEETKKVVLDAHIGTLRNSSSPEVEVEGGCINGTFIGYIGKKPLYTALIHMTPSIDSFRYVVVFAHIPSIDAAMIAPAVCSFICEEKETNPAIFFEFCFLLDEKEERFIAIKGHGNPTFYDEVDFE